jgi:hypothetical protein
LQEEEQEEEREAEHASSAVGLLLLLKDGDERPIGIMSNAREKLGPAPG